MVHSIVDPCSKAIYLIARTIYCTIFAYIDFRECYGKVDGNG